MKGSGSLSKHRIERRTRPRQTRPQRDGSAHRLGTRLLGVDQRSGSVDLLPKHASTKVMYTRVVRSPAFGLSVIAYFAGAWVIAQATSHSHPENIPTRQPSGVEATTRGGMFPGPPTARTQREEHTGDALDVAAPVVEVDPQFFLRLRQAVDGLDRQIDPVAASTELEVQLPSPVPAAESESPPPVLTAPPAGEDTPQVPPTTINPAEPPLESPMPPAPLTTNNPAEPPLEPPMPPPPSPEG